MSKYQLGQYKGTISEVGIYSFTSKDKETGQDVEKQHITFRAELKTHINPKTNEETEVPEGITSPEITHYLCGKSLEGKGFEYTTKFLQTLAGEETFANCGLDCFNDGSLIGKEVTVVAAPDNRENSKYPIQFSLFTGYGPGKKRDESTKSDKGKLRSLNNLFGITPKKTSTPPAAPVSAVEKDSFV